VDGEQPISDVRRKLGGQVGPVPRTRG
jgi:hypothetical protein